MPKIQTPLQFLNELHEYIQKADYRIYIQTMNFENGDVIQSLKPLLIEKAKKGVDVRINFDWVAQKYAGGDIALLPTLSPQQKRQRNHFSQEIHQLMQELQRYGIRIQEIRQPSLTSRLVPILNRDHKKIYLIDEKVAWIGGVNLIDGAFDNIDCMLRCRNTNYITVIANAFLSSNTTVRDKVYQVSEKENILLDGGKRNSSVIYDTAIAMAQSAKRKIVFMSQFLPDGPLLDVLTRKRLEQVKIDVYTSPEDSHSFTRLPYKFVFDRAKKRLDEQGVPIHFLTKKVHAKIIMVDDTYLMIGSHNLVNIGVKLGTSEIAIWSQDRDLLLQCQEFFYDHVTKYDLHNSHHIPQFI